MRSQLFISKIARDAPEKCPAYDWCPERKGPDRDLTLDARQFKVFAGSVIATVLRVVVDPHISSSTSIDFSSLHCSTCLAEAQHSMSQASRALHGPEILPTSSNGTSAADDPKNIPGCDDLLLSSSLASSHFKSSIMRIRYRVVSHSITSVMRRCPPSSSIERSCAISSLLCSL